MQWRAARARFGELNTRSAFDLVVQSAVNSVQAQVADMKHEAGLCRVWVAEWAAGGDDTAAESGAGVGADDAEGENQQDWSAKVLKKAAGLQAEADRLQRNLEHLQTYVELFRGAPRATNLQEAWVALLQQRRADPSQALSAEDLQYDCQVAFLSREIEETYDGPDLE